MKKYLLSLILGLALVLGINSSPITASSCNCSSPSPSPTVSPSPVVNPSPSPNPSPSVSPSPSPNPSPSVSHSPTPTTSPSPEPSGFVGLGKNGPSCQSNNFTARLTVKNNGQGQSGVKVTFNYKADEKTAMTNTNGEAAVDFEFKGNGEINAKADGYPNQQIGVEGPKDCPAAGGDPQVLGASSENTGGQILGASTMAATGNSVGDLFNWLFALGSSLVGTGLNLYAKKKE